MTPHETGSGMDIAIPLRPALLMRFENVPEDAMHFLEAEYGRMHVAADPDVTADLHVTWVDEVDMPKSWDSLGREAMLADGDLFVRSESSKARIRFGNDTIRAHVERDMPVDDVRRRVVGAALALLAPQCGALLVHGSAVHGPRGNHLILGEPGTGKTALLTGLIDRDHEYIADDQLFVSKDGALVPLQGLLELRLDHLARDAELGRRTRSTGWHQARALRSLIRSGRGTLRRIPSASARRAAGALRALETALNRHPFFADPAAVFGGENVPPRDTRTVAHLMTRGEPSLVEPTEPAVVVRWLTERAAYAAHPLTSLMSAAAVVDPNWGAALERFEEQVRSMATSAGHQIEGRRMRLPIAVRGEDAAGIIME